MDISEYLVYLWNRDEMVQAFVFKILKGYDQPFP